MQQNAGCSPVLLTSLARRKFSKDKKTQDNLGPYSAETIKLASNLGLPVSSVHVCAGFDVSTDPEARTAPPALS